MALTLTGCAESSESAVISQTEVTSATEGTTVTEAASESTTTDEYYGDVSPILHVKGMEHYSFKVDTDGVWVYYDDTMIQLLPADTEQLLEYTDHYAPEELLYYRDYDFDGWNDLFIPEVLGRANMPGRYYRFNTETGLFDVWAELDEIGLYIHPNNDGTLTCSVTSSAVDHKSTVYKWQDGKLTAIRREVQYQSGDGEIYIDYFTVSDGEEQLYKRERALLDEDDHDWYGTEEVPIE